MTATHKIREDNKVKKEPEYEESEEESQEIVTPSEIEKLTDDCLIEIFQHLQTIADKIRLERVCKRWQHLSQRSWSNFKSLDLSTKTWGIQRNIFGHSPFIRDIDFDKIIRLSGRYLTSITTDITTFAEICHLLTNIRELQLLEPCINESKRDDVSADECRNCGSTREATRQCTYDAWQVILSWLMSHGKNVRSFGMKITHSHYKEEDFVRFLGEMKQLKTFHLHTGLYLKWSGTFLLELPFDMIQGIILRTNVVLLPFDNNLSLMIKKCKKLETFGIERCEESEYVGVLRLISSQAASLKNFKLISGDRLSNQSALLSTASALINLDKLDVSRCKIVNDAFLEVVAKSCKKLTYLDISFCHQVTYRGMRRICNNLQKLTYLDIGYIRGLKNPPLEKLTSLVILKCSLNRNMELKCFRSVLKKAYQLRALDIERCRVSYKLLDIATDVAKTRNGNNTLDLYVKDTLICRCEPDKKAPLLNIINSSFMPLAKYGIAYPFLEIKNPEVVIYEVVM